MAVERLVSDDGPGTGAPGVFSGGPSCEGGADPQFEQGSVVPVAKAQEEIPPLRIGYRTDLGVMFWGKIESLISSSRRKDYEGKVQLIFTSPPFPLNRKKRYGNKNGDEYRGWLASLAPQLASLLTPTGSIVIEIGNAWEPGRAVMSTLAVRALLDFMDAADLKLCQQFVCHNPARLPTPAQWVNIERTRVKDSFTHVWWMSPTDEPKANNRKVLADYKPSMRELLRTGKYNAGKRPSGHKIGQKSFLTDNGGAIPSSVLEFSNTYSSDGYREFCKDAELPIHPARMAPGLADFFIRFLTDEGDLVLDPFGGSNITGAVAECLKRNWVAVEPDLDYIEGSQARFEVTRPGSALG